MHSVGTNITRMHRSSTRLHRGITIIHSSAARWRRRRIGNPVDAAFIKGLGDNNNNIHNIKNNKNNSSNNTTIATIITILTRSTQESANLCSSAGISTWQHWPIYLKSLRS